MLLNFKMNQTETELIQSSEYFSHCIVEHIDFYPLTSSMPESINKTSLC